MKLIYALRVDQAQGDSLNSLALLLLLMRVARLLKQHQVHLQHSFLSLHYAVFHIRVGHLTNLGKRPSNRLF